MNNTNTHFFLRALSAVPGVPSGQWVKSYGEAAGFYTSPDMAGGLRYDNGADAMAAQTALAALGVAVSIVATTAPVN